MKMTKKLVGVILAAVMVLTCLTACGGKKDMEYPEDFQKFMDVLDTDFLMMWTKLYQREGMILLWDSDQQDHLRKRRLPSI